MFSGCHVKNANSRANNGKRPSNSSSCHSKVIPSLCLGTGKARVVILLWNVGICLSWENYVLSQNKLIPFDLKIEIYFVNLVGTVVCG